LFVTLAIAPDRRRIEVEPDERVHAAVVGVAPRLVAVRVEAARAMLQVERTRTYVAHQCASIEEYGVRFLGVSAREARDLVDLGRALDAPPTAAVVAAVESARAEEGAEVASSEGGSADAGTSATEEIEPHAAPVAAVTVADAVLAGALSVERAVAAGQFLRKPDLLRDGEDPVALAMSGSMRQVRWTIRSREEEIAQREAVVMLPLAVTVRTRDSFRRAKSLASERAGTMLTEGQTFALVVNRWLDQYDPMRRGEGTRRVPDTAGLPGQRYVPKSVRRAVLRRSGGQCEVPGCTRRTFLQLAHDESHASGGSREEENLWNACVVHHTQFDAGLIRICGWQDGHPRFCGVEGQLLEDRARIAPQPAGVDWDRGTDDAATLDPLMDARLRARPPPRG
jgi:hypothetical protein